MESNSDKAMRDKLGGVEMPFDPAAWEQMEAMLNKEEKKRGFFWWWFGAGMAGLLLLAGAGAYLATNGNAGGKGQIAVNTTNEKANVKGENAVSNGGNVAGNEQNVVDDDGKVGSMQTAVSNEKGAASNKQLEVSNNGQQNALSTTDINRKQKTNSHTKGNTVANAGKKRHSNLNGNSAVQNGGETIGTTVAFARPRHVTNKAISTDNRKPKTENRKQENNNSTILTDFNGKQITGAPVAAKPETVTADKYWLTYLNPNADDYNPAKAEGNDELPKKLKAKVFQYSIGALGNVSTAMVNTSVEGNDISLGYKPSSMGGFTHDFLFANRFAISNSILYAQSHFTVSNVRSESFTPAPLSFNCSITELAIPIGIKVYPVSTAKFRFYISAGIINHIKLKETFTYTVDRPDSVSNIPNAADVKNTYPTQTSFDGTGNGAIETNGYNLGTATNVTTVVSVNTDEFSINNARRYYTSFYAGAGLEGIIKNKWILFAEPTFSMDLQKIGIQERRRYNVGANLGFRYQF